MKKTYQYIMVAVLMALLPTKAFAYYGYKEFEQKSDYSVSYDATSYTFTFSLMVHAHDNVNGVIWRGQGTLEMSHDQKEWHPVASFWGNNYDQQDAGTAQDTYVENITSCYNNDLIRTTYTGEQYNDKYSKAYMTGGEWKTINSSHCDNACMCNFSLKFPASTFDGDNNKNVFFRVKVSPDFEANYTVNIYSGNVSVNVAKPMLMTPYIDFSSGSYAAGRLVFAYSIGQDFKNATLHVGNSSYTLPQGTTDGTYTIDPIENRTSANLDVELDGGIKRTSDFVNVQPYKSIQRMVAERNYLENTDKTKTPLERYGGNVLTWEMKEPGADLYNMDQFVIMRGYKSDYSDLETIGSVPITQYDRSVENVAKYTYTDEASEATAFNTDESAKPDSVPGLAKPRIYYVVARATAYGSWGVNADSYVKKAYVEKMHGLPDVTGLTVVKEDSLQYKSNHRVKIRVELAEKSAYFTHCIWHSSASIVIQRRNILGGAGNKDITIDGASVLWDSDKGVYYAETTDEIEYELNEFTYSAVVQNSNKYIRSNPDPVRFITTSDTKALVYSLAADLKELSASTDEYDQVSVKWSSPQGLVTSGKLERIEVTGANDATPKEYDGVKSEWQELSNFDWKAGLYIDSDIKISHYYQYRATLSYTCDGMTSTSVTEVCPIGYCNQYGKVSGRIATKNGMGVAGVTVQIARKDDATQVIEVTTDANGSYEKDHLVIAGETTTYTIAPAGDFQRTVNSSATYDAVLGNGKSYHSGIDFQPSTEYRINGRVLYDGTTVPVAHANFKLNGKLLYKSAGSLVETDGTGNFSFTLPKNQWIETLQVVKEGHAFKTDGMVKNKEEKTSFQLTNNIESIQLHDMTKTRLAGRVVGGYVQQAKPLGFGLSRNNLGDSITVVMQLEGDNTAYLVYDEKDINIKTRQDTVISQMNDTTITNVERKRMLVHVNQKTGEFFVDLLPVKYKISAMSATGYGSLFNKGMVSQVIDMTDSLTCHEYTYTEPSEGQASATPKTYTTAYNAAFNYAYHNGINITYTQMVQANYGELPYLGESTVVYTDITGNAATLNLAEKDANGIYQYTLGYPLFVENNTYNIKGKAHEDYYYNNDKTTSNIDIVPVTTGTMVIDNGLTSKLTTTKTTLDSNGECLITFVAGNQLFTQTGEKALGELNMSLDIEGNYFDATPLKAYITGTRSQTTGTTTNVVDENANIQLVDILRDPPGSKSSASIDAGTTWDMTYKLDFSSSVGLTFNISKGTGSNSFAGSVAAPSGAGSTQGMIFSSKTLWDYSFPISIPCYSTSQNYTFKLTTNDKITTSSEAVDCGAMSDVFVGATQNMQYSTKDVISVIDESAYQRMLPAISTKDVTVIQKGTQADGSNIYLVRAEQMSASMSYPVLFTYTQRHIYEHILPTLVKARSELVKVMSAEAAQTLANSTKEPVYYTSNPDWELTENLKADTARTDYSIAVPDGQKLVVDKVKAYSRAITNWVIILLKNETDKVDAFKNLQAYKSTYSISSGVTRTFTQGESDTDVDKTCPAYANSTNVGNAIASQLVKNISAVGNSALKAFLTKKGDNGDKSVDKNENYADGVLNTVKNYLSDSALKNPQNTEVNCGATVIKWSITPNIDVNFSMSKSSNTSNTHSRSFTLGTSDDSYLDIEVYKARVDSTITGYSQMKTAIEKTYGSLTNNNVFLNNYIFREVGGATRNPWQDADSTVWYVNESTLKPYPLAARTLKIDNPKLIINEPERNNVLPDDKAYFTIRMSNESELGAGAKLTKASSLTLCVVQGTNPNGAQIYIDGTPLGTGMTFSISPNSQLTKTMTVLRGTGFDFENIQLMLYANATNPEQYSTQYFSIHYVPSASPVSITSPGDKWVMNTLSSKDDNGYYMPITIEGFDVNHAGFDHIEMQYKKHTEGTVGWTNLCSYFANDSIYEKANGTKKMIKSGRITDFRFYGERDPMEMQYDVRAVAYSRNGTEFVTNSSDIITGTKDTRCPEVFGNPQPADGILYYTDNIELPFTEPIAYNYLDETNNFTIEGYTNNTSINEGRTLYFPGTPDQCAKTQIERNLSNRSFTIDMMVKAAEENKEMTFFSQKVDGKTALKFGVTADQHLFADFNGTVIKSDSVVRHISEALHSTAVICDKTTSGEMKVTFFYDDQGILQADKTLPKAYEGVGPIYLGTDATSPETAPFQGNMLNVRLWNKALSAATLKQQMGKLLNGYQSMLKDYWPLTESSGSTAADKVSGANLNLASTTWASTEKLSLRLSQAHPGPINFSSSDFSCSKDNDYSLGFWFRTANDYTPDDTKFVTIFGIGNDDNPKKGTSGMRIGFTDGNFVLRTGGQDYTIATTEATANAKWHYYMMCVSPSMSTASIYLDNKLIAKPFTDDLDGVGSNGAHFGGNGFIGNIDMFTVWEVALSKGYLTDIGDKLLTGKEQGLIMYMPFTVNETSDQGLYRPVFSPYNERVATTQNSAGETVIKDKVLMLTKGTAEGDYTNDENSGDGEDSEDNTDKAIFAPMASPQEFKKIPFKWSSTSTSLMINLNIPDNEIDKQNIHIQVRDVEDLNGNPMASPMSWTIYPDLTRLRWDSRYMSHSKAYGTQENLELQWSNSSGNSINYTITTTSSRINIGTTSGVAAANSTNAVTITLDSEMPTGEYDEYIYINDLDHDLTEPLRIRFNVVAKEPDWTVTTNQDFNQTMSVIATVKKKGDDGNWYQDVNTNDIVGAFIGDECVGKTNITYDEESQQSGIYMTVRGKTFTDASGNVVKRPVTFRLWDATENSVSSLSVYNKKSTYFVKNAILGIDAPLDMRTSNYEYQYIDLAQGWNWVSFNVNPKDAEGGPNNFLRCNAGFSEGDIFSLTGTDEFFSYSASNNRWEGSDTSAEYNSNNVYQIYANKAGTVSVNGEAYTDSNRVVVVNVNKGEWTQLAYLLSASQPLSTALSDFAIGDRCAVGSVIKSFDAFAVATSSNKWVGSLKYMVPGKGYFLRSDSTINDTIRYTNTTSTGAKVTMTTSDNEALSSPSGETEQEGISQISSAREHNSSMPVIASFADGDARQGDVLVAYSNGEVVGAAEFMPLDDDVCATMPTGHKGLFFLSVNAENGSFIKFAKMRDGEIVNVTSSSIDYQPKAVIGTLAKPLLINFDTVGIGSVSADDDAYSDGYDIMGRKYREYKDIHKKSGVYIINGKKVAR